MVEKIKKAIEPFYTDLCSVYEKNAVVKDGRTQFEEVLRYENVPCRMSAKAFLFGENAASEKNNVTGLSKKTKLFLPPEYVVKPGSRIVVESLGQETVFAKSGKMSCYSSHNEVMVELLKNYA